MWEFGLFPVPNMDSFPVIHTRATIIGFQANQELKYTKGFRNS